MVFGANPTDNFFAKFESRHAIRVRYGQAEIANEFAEITNEFPEIANEFPEIANEFPEIANEFPEITNEFPEIANLAIQVMSKSPRKT